MTSTPTLVTVETPYKANAQMQAQCGAVLDKILPFVVRVARMTGYENPLVDKARVMSYRNVLYARAAMLDCYLRNEAPLASHLLGPQVLDDDNPEERALGMRAGFAWNAHASFAAVYVDLGVSRGMAEGLIARSFPDMPLRNELLDRCHYHNGLTDAQLEEIRARDGQCGELVPAERIAWRTLSGNAQVWYEYAVPKEIRYLR